MPSNHNCCYISGEAETHDAFKKHFDEQLLLYKFINAVTLVELSGKEKMIGDAYIDNVLKYNSQDVTYITFDFHEYWYKVFIIMSFSHW
jgi:hypothetical protein